MIARSLTEVAAPDSLLNATLYHGCPEEGKAESIMRNGISYQELKFGSPRSSKSQLAPVSGRIYLARKVGYAMIYALGGDMAGHVYREEYWRGGRFGYLFVVDGAQLSDVEPDEDQIGLVPLVQQTLDEGKPQVFDSPFVSSLVREPSFLRTCSSLIKKAMTPRQLERSIWGELSYMAAGGKRALKVMPDWMKLKLVELGADLSHAGTLVPKEAWRIDKGRCQDLDEDGSNFFDVAERVA